MGLTNVRRNTQLNKNIPTLKAYRGCGLDFLVTKQRRSIKPRVNPPEFLGESKWGIQKHDSFSRLWALNEWPPGLFFCRKVLLIQVDSDSNNAW